MDESRMAGGSLGRGSRAFGYKLTWIPVADAFAAARCPACGAAEPLVATRERLGCLQCS